MGRSGNQQECGQEWDEPPMQIRAQLEKLVSREVEQEDWGRVLWLLAQLPDPVPRDTARNCLRSAIGTAPAEVFSALLDRLPPGEYRVDETCDIGCSLHDEMCPQHGWEVYVQGTLVMYAAAKNRPRHLEILLQRGHDVNSASLPAAQALLEDYEQCGACAHYGQDVVPFQPFTARPESCLSLQRRDAEPEDLTILEIEGATPLAAALLLGNWECARLLVDHGAWLQESPGISQIMWLPWRGEDGDDQHVRTCAFARSGANSRPVLWALGRTCTPHQLEKVLQTWTYSREELSRAARAMLVDCRCFRNERWQGEGLKVLCRRLELLGQICPEALCAPEVAGELLHFMQENQWSLKMFLPILRGKQFDLSGFPGPFSWLGTEEGMRMMEALASRCTCVMARDSVPLGTRAPVLRRLMKWVTFLPHEEDRGISNLTLAILETGCSQLIRQALRQGVIPPEETTEELLCCQRKLGLPPVCRTLLLTFPRPERTDQPEARRVTDREPPQWFAECIPGDVTSRLKEGKWKHWFCTMVKLEVGHCQVEAAGVNWQVDLAFMVLCMLGETELVARWLSYRPVNLRNTDGIYCKQQRLHVVTTPLCAAALAGHTETVRLLLESGAQAAEESCGFPSVWYTCWPSDNFGPIPVTPLAAALLGEHWDMAQLLVDHGAGCCLGVPELHKLWRCLRGDAPEEGVEGRWRDFLL